jgi:hypothetical protein
MTQEANTEVMKWICTMINNFMANTQKPTNKATTKQCNKHIVGGSALREHCDFKDAPCNYTGKG